MEWIILLFSLAFWDVATQPAEACDPLLPVCDQPAACVNSPAALSGQRFEHSERRRWSD